MRSLIVTAVAALFLAPVPARADIITTVVDPYLRIQTALANDALDPVKADARQIATAASALGAQGKPLAASATELGAASTLDAAREAFGRLSDALITYAESTKTSLGDDMTVAYCSMEKKSWVQKGTAISNPYGGKQMQRCGEIVKAVK